MSTNTYQMFLIDALTNMHVGSGDTHFGVVDNLIQRNPVTKVPVIHSSGIKGALLDYFQDDAELQKDNNLITLFGGKMERDADDKEKKLAFYPGHLIFFEANLLLLPLRANYNVYYYCTSIQVARDFFEQLRTFLAHNKEIEELEKWFLTLSVGSADFLHFGEHDDLEIEDFTKGKKHAAEIPANITSLVKKYLHAELAHLAVFNDNTFKTICERSIPVVARNQIKEDGTSGNLFYEEVLPRKSKLYFLLGYDAHLNNGKKNLKENFNKKFNKKENTYQFGANFSIGYGFSKIYQIV